MNTRILRAARWCAMLSAGILCWWLVMSFLGVPLGLPVWRIIGGSLSFGAAVALWINA
jgi:hypothetical protein